MGRLVGCKRYLLTLLIFARRHGRYFGVNHYLTLEWSFGRWLDHLRLHLGVHPAVGRPSAAAKREETGALSSPMSNHEGED